MSRTEDDKGEIEVRLVRMFANALKLETAAEPCKLMPPDPDVELVLSSGDRIGVELSALKLRDHLAHRTQPAFESALREARELYLQGSGPPVSVSVARSFQPESEDVGGRWIAQKWAELIRKYAPATGEMFELNVTNDADRDLPPLVESVTISRRPEQSDGWRLSSTAPASMVSVEELQATISAKDKPFAGYDRRHAERWLLLHNGFGREALAASRYSPSELARFSFRSPFDRVFLLTGDGVEELTIARSG